MSIILKVVRENQHHDSPLGDLCTDICREINILSGKLEPYRFPSDEWQQFCYIKRIEERHPHTRPAVKQLIKLIIKAI